ncbi:MAG: acyl carrier protein [Eubacterium sp.]|nr:acyl carrier protein [Eubacterium sp.]
MKKMFEQIKEMIVEELGVEESQVTESVSFKDDLGADSLDLFELVMRIEDEFGVKIPTEELETINTVGDVLKYIESHQ